MRRDVCKELGIRIKLKDDAFPKLKERNLKIDAANEAESTTDPSEREQKRDKESQPSCSKDENPETTSIFVDLNQSFESVEMDESFSDTDWSHKDEECDLSSDDNDNEAGNSNYRNSVR
eukprot:gene10085-18736_t